MSNPQHRMPLDTAGPSPHTTTQPYAYPPFFQPYNYYPPHPAAAETTTTITTVTSPPRPQYIPDTRQGPSTTTYQPFAFHPPYPTNPAHLVQQPFSIPSANLTRGPPLDATGTPYGNLNTAPSSPTPESRGRKRKTATGTAPQAKRARRTAAKSKAPAEPATSLPVVTPLVPGVGPAQIGANSSNTSPHGLTFNSLVLHPKENDADRASDVWYFVRPLAAREKPVDWIEPVGDSEARVKSKPKTPFVGCRLCRHEWKVWKTTGMTATIRNHLEKRHHAEYISDVLKHQLKGHATIDKAREAVKSKDREVFDPENHDQSLERLYDYMVKWAAVDDQSFNCVECPEFRDMLLYLCSDLENEDIPHRTRFTELIMDRFKIRMSTLMDELKSAVGRISYTSDLWSNLKLTSYMAITAHFCAFDQHGNLVIRSRLIAFRAITGSHTGVNMASSLLEVLKEYGILHKLGEITLDNASNNDTMMRELQRLLTELGIPFDAEQNRIRCFPHVINICAKTGLKQLTKLPKESRNKDEDDRTELEEDSSAPDLDELRDPDDPGDFGVDMEDNMALQADIIYLDALESDPVSLARAAVRTCRASGERRDEFRKTIITSNATQSFVDGRQLQVLELVLDVITRWSATFLMIDRFLTLYEAIDVFLGKSKHQKLRSLLFDEDQLKVLDDIRTFLQSFHMVQELLSAEKTPTLSIAIPAYEYLLQYLILLRKSLAKLAHGINASIRKLSKYIKCARKTRIYALAMVIHPEHKFTWMEKYWTKEEQAAARAWVIDAMLSFRRAMPSRTGDLPGPLPSSNPAHKQVAGLRRLTSKLRDLESQVTDSSDSGTSSALPEIPTLTSNAPAATAEQIETENRRLVEEELTKYIADGVVSENDELDNHGLCRYWQANRYKYPMLYRIALDVMPVQASAVPCERVFSSSKETFTARRTHISDVHMEVLQIMKYLTRQERDGLNFSAGRLATEEDLLRAEELEAHTDNTNTDTSSAHSILIS